MNLLQMFTMIVLFAISSSEAFSEDDSVPRLELVSGVTQAPNRWTLMGDGIVSATKVGILRCWRHEPGKSPVLETYIIKNEGLVKMKAWLKINFVPSLQKTTTDGALYSYSPEFSLQLYPESSDGKYKLGGYICSIPMESVFKRMDYSVFLTLVKQWNAKKIEFEEFITEE